MSKNKDNNVEQNNIVEVDFGTAEVDFGTTEPNTQEVDAEQEALREQYINMLLNIGQSTYEWAMYATRDEYVAHMLELYDYMHPEQAQAKSVITVPEKKIILPS